MSTSCFRDLLNRESDNFLLVSPNKDYTTMICKNIARELGNTVDDISFASCKKLQSHFLRRRNSIFNVRPDLFLNEEFYKNCEDAGLQIIILQSDLQTINEHVGEKASIDSNSNGIKSKILDKQSNVQVIDVTGLSPKWAAKKILNREKMSQKELNLPFYHGVRDIYSLAGKKIPDSPRFL